MRVLKRVLAGAMLGAAAASSALVGPAFACRDYSVERSYSADPAMTQEVGYATFTCKGQTYSYGQVTAYYLESRERCGGCMPPGGWPTN